jgi:hypothetical protein
MTKTGWRRIAYGAGGLAAGLVVAFGIVFQDGIVRFFATPRTPFQTVTPPPPPEYAARGAWLVWPEASDTGAADVFYVHSTTYYRRKLWNGPVNAEPADTVRRTVAAPNEAGPFAKIGNVYGPRYREATLFSLFTHKYDGLAARELAYSDVKRAFVDFLAKRDPARPIIVAGYGQGGVYVLGLMREYFQGDINPLRRKLVAAYVIGTSTPGEFLAGLNPAIPVCQTPEAVRCLISYVDFEPRFDEEMERIRARSLAWDASGDLVSMKSRDLVCVNPLSWAVNGGYEPPERNIGAASATGIARGSPPPAIAKAVGAKCVNGILVVDNPKRRFLRRGDWFGAKWKAQPFNLFYYDLAENAGVRLAALQKILKVEPEPLEPIGETIDLVKSPVNKVPN